MKYVTLYLADDHQIVIDGLKLLISNELNIRVVGMANDGDTTYKELKVKKPDIALIDLRMPGMNGLQLIIKLKKIIDTKFIILSMYNDKRYINDAIDYGASGYLLKNAGKKEVMDCINSIMDGGTHFPNELIKRNDSDELFTPRELEIIKLIINESTTQSIAQKLNLSHYTVETHRKNICRKTNTNTPIGLYKFLVNNKIDIL